MKDKVCTIYLVRHGETDYNIQRRFQGHIDTPLNKAGKKQAVELAKKFTSLHLDFVYSSDLIRAKETAAEIAKEKKLEIRLTKLFRERNFGKAEGRSLTEDKELILLLDRFATLSPDKQWHSRVLPGWETNEELVGRAFTHLRSLALQHLGDNILVVTHGTVIVTLLAHLGYLTRKEMYSGRLKNGAIIELQSDGITFIVKSVEGLTLPDKL
jgi:broad specificity phosphatase PhoE